MSLKCRRAVKRVAKTAAQELTPIGFRMISVIVGELATTDLTSREKRRASKAAVKAAFKEAKIEARSSVINLGIETAVGALKKGADHLAALGQVEEGDFDDPELVGDVEAG